MNTKWFKMLGVAVVVGILGVMAFGAVAFAQDPTPNNPVPWGFGHGMRGFGMRGGFGNFAMPQNSFFAIAAKALGMTETDLYAQLQQGKSIAELAKEKNVDTATIVTEALKQHEDALKAAVAQNQITQAQADAMLALHKANIESKLTYKYDAGNLAPRGFGMFGHGGFGHNSFLSAAATAFNMTAADLYAQLQAGKTLADIAKEKNVDTAKLVSDYVQSYADSLKTAVSQNRLTQAQADTMLAQLKANAEALLTQKFDATNFGQPGFGMFGRGGRGGHGGFGWWGQR